MTIDLSEIRMIDTHEHLVPEHERIAQGGDVFAVLFSHYASTDLQISGISRRDLDLLRDISQPFSKRWTILKPYWEWMASTAYGTAIRLAALELYGVKRFDEAGFQELAEKMREASTIGLYQSIFSKTKIEYAVLQDTQPGPLPVPFDPPDLFRPVLKAWMLALIRSKVEIEAICNQIGSGPVHSLEEWVEVCKYIFTKTHQYVAIKLGHAYISSLAIERPTISEAEKVFNRIVKKRELFGVDESLGWDEVKPLHDYLTHQIIRLAIQHQLPIQIHTGLLENTYNDIREAHPMHLIPVFLEYPEARFVLFHGGYPWTSEFCVLGKSFPNVWLDLSWLWVISPGKGRQLLHELIETIPANKVCAFGGDYLFIEGTYAHSCMARRNITRVLEEKIAEGWFDEMEALKYAQSILYDNPVFLYEK